MKEAAVIVIDAGTGDCRVAAFSDKGEPLASAHREWTYQSGREGIPGAFAFDPEGCWRSVKELLQAVTARAGWGCMWRSATGPGPPAIRQTTAWR